MIQRLVSTCNVCHHDIYQVENMREWKCRLGCCCLMLGCVPSTPAVTVELPTPKMPCVYCGEFVCELGQKQCDDCALAEEFDSHCPGTPHRGHTKKNTPCPLDALPAHVVQARGKS